MKMSDLGSDWRFIRSTSRAIEQPDADGDERGDDDPQQRADSVRSGRRVGERALVVLEARRTCRLLVGDRLLVAEAQVDGRDRRDDEADEQRAARPDRGRSTMVSGRCEPAGRPPGDEEDDEQDGEEAADRLDDTGSASTAESESRGRQDRRCDEQPR